MSDELLAKWLDDRRSLSEEEALELERSLSADGELARRAKDQLQTDDLLSRRFAIDRGHFESQVAKRLANPTTEESFTASTLAAARRSQRRRSVWLWEGAAAALLIAGLLLILLRNSPEPATPAAGPTGLRAEYFQGRDLLGVPMERRDDKIDFVWRKGSGPIEAWEDMFSIRWTGKIAPRYSERYTFRTQNDDGVRVWIGDTLLIDDWKGRPVVAENRAEIVLEAEKRYDLKIEYFNGGDLGVLRLYWSSPTQKEEIVPSSRLTP